MTTATLKYARRYQTASGPDFDAEVPAGTQVEVLGEDGERITLGGKDYVRIMLPASLGEDLAYAERLAPEADLEMA